MSKSQKKGSGDASMIACWSAKRIRIMALFTTQTVGKEGARGRAREGGLQLKSSPGEKKETTHSN